MCDGNKVIAESKIVNNTQFSSVLKDNGSFKYKKFIDCTFNNCVFDGTNFAGASLLWCKFNNCTFKRCNFSNSVLRQSDFTTSIFKDCINWHSANLEFAQFNEEFQQELINLVFKKVIFEHSLKVM